MLMGLCWRRPQKRNALGAHSVPFQTLVSHFPMFIPPASNQSNLLCTGKELKPRLLPCSEGRRQRRKCLNSSDSFPVEGKLLGCVTGIRPEPQSRRTLPVCGQACGKARGSSQLDWSLGIFLQLGPKAGKCRLLASCTGRGQHWPQAPVELEGKQPGLAKARAA